MIGYFLVGSLAISFLTLTVFAVRGAMYSVRQRKIIERHDSINGVPKELSEATKRVLENRKRKLKEGAIEDALNNNLSKTGIRRGAA